MKSGDSALWVVEVIIEEVTLPNQERQLLALFDDRDKVFKGDIGIVKGLKRPDWPLDGWQALQRLALQLCAFCDAGTSQAGSRGKMPA